MIQGVSFITALSTAALMGMSRQMPAVYCNMAPVLMEMILRDTANGVLYLSKYEVLILM
jgi:hypothetical protein